jgi:hypothetical protein
MTLSGIEPAVLQPTALLRIPNANIYLCKKKPYTGNIQDTALCNEDAAVILIRIEMYCQ